MDTKGLFDLLTKNHDEVHGCINKVEDQCDERFKTTTEGLGKQDSRLAVIEQRLNAEETKCATCKADLRREIKSASPPPIAPVAEKPKDRGTLIPLIGGALVILNSLAMAILLIWLRSGGGP